MKTNKRGRPLGSKNKPKFEIEECTFETDTLKKQLSYGKEQPDWTFLYVFIIGLAIGVLFTHEYIIKCVDLIK